MPSIEDIDALLPQTQCGECGYKGCKPYATALQKGEASIDLCPPGGVEGLKALGKLLNVDPTPFLEAASVNTRAPSLAVINEQECIGCTKCIQACPVDAIIGRNKKMHSIIDIECTGCGLCVEPCPVDCIEMTPLETPLFDKPLAKRRFAAKERRQQSENQKNREQYQQKSQTRSDVESIDKKAYILAALKRKQKK